MVKCFYKSAAQIDFKEKRKFLNFKSRRDVIEYKKKELFMPIQYVLIKKRTFVHVELVDYEWLRKEVENIQC